MSEPITVSLSELLSGTRKPGNRPIPEAQIATLLEASARYSAPCPFKAGDIVTPRKCFGYSGAGIPNVVLEVAAEPHRNFQPSNHVTPVSSVFGSRLDVRVASLGPSGDVVSFWQESWCLEMWQAGDQK